MHKYPAVIMAVIGLLWATPCILPQAARAQVETTTRLTTSAEYVVMEGTVSEDSDSQSNASVDGSLIESEVSFYGQTHGLGPCSLLTRCNDPATAIARAESQNIHDLRAEVLQAVFGRSHFIARAGVSKTFSNTSALPATVDISINLTPIQLLTDGYCSTGPGAPTAVYDIELRVFWPNGQNEVLFHSSGNLAGGTQHHNLTTGGEELNATMFVLLPGFVGYEFDGLIRNYDLGTLYSGQSMTATLKLYMSAEGGSAVACSHNPPSQFPWFSWGAGAYMDGPFDSITLSADFHAGPVNGAAPLNVHFADRSTGYITSWSWNFGDGSTSTERNPKHTYTDPGVYAVTLTVTDSDGQDTELKSAYINVDARRAIAVPWLILLDGDE